MVKHLLKLVPLKSLYSQEDESVLKHLVLHILSYFYVEWYALPWDDINKTKSILHVKTEDAVAFTFILIRDRFQTY